MSESLRTIIASLPPEFSACLTEYTARLAAASSSLGIGEIPFDVLLETPHLKESTLSGGEYPFDVARALGELRVHPDVAQRIAANASTGEARKLLLDELAQLPRDQRMSRARALGMTGADKKQAPNNGPDLDTIRSIKDPATRMSLARKAGL